MLSETDSRLVKLPFTSSEVHQNHLEIFSKIYLPVLLHSPDKMSLHVT